MRGATRILVNAVRALAIVQIVLGIVFWTGNELALVPIHMALGSLLVLSLWALAVLGLVARIPPVFSIAGLVWGALTVGYGMTQESVLVGSQHWIAQLIHLAVGITAVLVADRIAASILGRRPRATAVA